MGRKPLPTLNSKSKSGIKGVYQIKSGKWRARIRIKGKLIHLGLFDRQVDAAIAVNAKASGV
jgi:hypothetical protein